MAKRMTRRETVVEGRLAAPFETVRVFVECCAGGVHAPHSDSPASYRYHITYEGPAELLLAAGCCCAKTIAPMKGGDPRGRHDIHGDRCFVDRRKGWIRFRCLWKSHDNLSRMPGINAGIIDEAQANRHQDLARVFSDTRGALTPQRDRCPVLIHPKFDRPAVHQPHPRKRKGTIDFCLRLAWRDYRKKRDESLRRQV